MKLQKIYRRYTKMAGICIAGIPGAGKSYLAASIIKPEYELKKRLIYTNVNLKVKYDEHLNFLDVEKLYEFAQKEYKLFLHFDKLSAEYVKQNAENDVFGLKEASKEEEKEEEISSADESSRKIFDRDDVSQYIGNYDKYLKDSGLLDSIEGALIVWDECHEVLQGSASVSGSLKADSVWIRFFSYHRHFNIDFYLITQDITLIHKRYRPFISKYYFVQNPAKRLFSTMIRYKVYTDSKQFERYYIETINIVMKKEIQEFYDSGEYKNSKSIILKKVAPAVALIAASLFSF